MSSRALSRTSGLRPSRRRRRRRAAARGTVVAQCEELEPVIDGDRVGGHARKELQALFFWKGPPQPRQRGETHAHDRRRAEKAVRRDTIEGGLVARAPGVQVAVSIGAQRRIRHWAPKFSSSATLLLRAGRPLQPNPARPRRD